MKILKLHIVPEDVQKQRMSDYAPLVFNDFIPSKKGIKKAIKKGAFLIDGQVAFTGSWILPGQKVQLMETPQQAKKVFELELEVVYEDDFLAIINKPGGIPVSGNYFRTIQKFSKFILIVI